jgi:hypothetical protein
MNDFFLFSQALRGGAIYIGSVSVSPIESTVFSACVATGDGGAVFYHNSTIRLTDVNFTGCISESGFGGAICSDSEVTGTSYLLQSCYFVGNMNGKVDGRRGLAGSDVVDRGGRADEAYDDTSVVDCLSESSVPLFYLQVMLLR